MAVAKSPLNLRREHGQVLGKFREQLPLFRVRRQITNEGTFGGVGAELLQPDLHVLHRRPRCSFAGTLQIPCFRPQVNTAIN